MDVLESEKDRTIGRQPVQRRHQTSEELPGAGPVARPDRAREQRRQRWEALDDIVALTFAQPRENLHERLEREGTVAQVEAVTDEDPLVGGGGTCRELEQQPGLADPGVTAEQHRAVGVSAADPGECQQLGELGRAAHQRVWRSPVGMHEPIMADHTDTVDEQAHAVAPWSLVRAPSRRAVRIRLLVLGLRLACIRSRRWLISAWTWYSGMRIMMRPFSDDSMTRSSPSEVGRHIGQLP